MTQQCSQCKEPAADGKKMCTKHVEKYREYARNKAEKANPKPAQEVKAVVPHHASKPRPAAPVVEIEVGPSSIDEAIATLEKRLQTLRDAKLVMQQLEVA